MALTEMNQCCFKVMLRVSTEITWCRHFALARITQPLMLGLNSEPTIIITHFRHFAILFHAYLTSTSTFFICLCVAYYPLFIGTRRSVPGARMTPPRFSPTLRGSSSNQGRKVVILVHDISITKAQLFSFINIFLKN